MKKNGIKIGKKLLHIAGHWLDFDMNTCGVTFPLFFIIFITFFRHMINAVHQNFPFKCAVEHKEPTQEIFNPQNYKALLLQNENKNKNKENKWSQTGWKGLETVYVTNADNASPFSNNNGTRHTKQFNS